MITREKALRQIDLLLDIGLTILAFIISATVKAWLLGGLLGGPVYLVLAAAIVCIWYLSLDLFTPYQAQRQGDLVEACAKVAQAVTFGTGVLLAGLYLVKSAEDVSRILIVLFFTLDLALLIGRRFWMRIHRRKATVRTRVLVIGSRQRARDVVRRLAKSPGYEVVGCLDVEESLVGGVIHDGVRVLASTERFDEILIGHSIDEVVFAIPVTQVPRAAQHLEFAERIGLVVRFVPEWGVYRIHYTPEIARMSLENYHNIPMLTMSSTPRDCDGLVIKHLLDWLLAAAGLIVAWPALLAIAAAVKVTSRGPVLFRQERVGMNGRRFTMYKFRTMVADAELRRDALESMNEMEGPVFKLANDPRVTPLGRWLRKTSLDELPQLLNVLKMEMSFVGPRPPLPREVSQYELWQRRRLSMRPGLTCTWQVSGRNRIDFVEWMRLDLEYIANWSLTYDFKLILRTVAVVLFAAGDNPRQKEPSPPAAPVDGAAGRETSVIQP